MGKGKGKARASLKSGTRKIATVRSPTSRAKSLKTSVAIEERKVDGEVVTAANITPGGGKKSASSRKSRPAEKNDTSNASSTSTGGGSRCHGSSGTLVEPPSPSSERFKLSCTCSHLAQHPDRQELLRKLVDIRIEVNTAAIRRQRAAVDVLGARKGQGFNIMASLSQCQECDEHAPDEQDQVLTCLGCGYTGCSSPTKRHILRHCLTQPGRVHSFAVNRARAEVFCALCCDYVYDAEFDAAISRIDDEFRLPRARASGGGSGLGFDAEGLRGKRRRRVRADGHYLVTDRFGQQPWREQSWPPPVLLSPGRGRLVAAGVRGMFNLGNTCFMSSVLQAVLHISVMQSFFFGKGHDPGRCEKLRKEIARLQAQILQYNGNASFDPPERGANPGSAKKLGNYCIACELARLFEDMFSTEAVEATMEHTEPYVPHRLLEAVWGASDALAGYEQQDAHEFLIAVLDSLHGHLDRAAKNEVSAQGLRRTLAAYKQRAKQRQEQANGSTATTASRKCDGETVSPRPSSSGGAGKSDAISEKKSRKRNRASVDGGKGKSAGWHDEQRMGGKGGSGSSGDGREGGGCPTGPRLPPVGGRSRPGVVDVSGGEAYRGKLDRNGRCPSLTTEEAAAAAAAATAAGSALSRGERGGGEGEASCSNGAATNAAGGGMQQRSRHGPGTGNSSRGGHAFLSAVPPAIRASSRDGGAGVKNDDNGTAGGVVGNGRDASGSGSKGAALNGQRLEDLDLQGFVQEVFAGVTRSDVVCTECGHVSCTYERFLEVSLPIRPGDAEFHHKRSSRGSAVPSRSPGSSRASRTSSESPTSSSVSGASGRASSRPFVPQQTGAAEGDRNRSHGGGSLPTSSRAAETATRADSVGVNAVPNSLSSLSSSCSTSSGLPQLLPALATTSVPRSSSSSQAGSSISTGGISPGCSDSPSIGSGITRNVGRVSPSSSLSDESVLFSSGTAAAQAGSLVGRQPSGEGTVIGPGSTASLSPDDEGLCGSGVRGGKDEVDESVRSIGDCFARFAAREDLTAHMECESCRDSVRKTKQMAFCSLPRVLVLHLKRFDALADKKIDDFVSFPARGLDMGQFLARRRTQDASNGYADDKAAGSRTPSPYLPYDLLAVVNHSGSMAQGHYTAFVQELGRWFRFDDTWVQEVEEEEVLASEAYLLFYFQRGADSCWRPTQASSSSSPGDGLSALFPPTQPPPSPMASSLSPGAPLACIAEIERRS